MKKLIPLFTVCLALNVAKAQHATKVNETTESISDASGNALTAIIYKSSDKAIAKDWKSLVKDYDDAEVKTKGTDVYATNVLIKEISEHQIKVYSQVKEINDEEHEISVIFMNGDEAISSSNDVAGYTAAKDILYRFANEHSKESTAKFLSLQAKALSKLEKDLKDLKRDKEKAEKEIDDCKKSIKDNEYNLEKNKDEQSDKEKEIDKQKTQVKSAKKTAGIFD